MSNGILLLGHEKESYVQMAWNLAHLLKATGTTVPIHLLTDFKGHIRRPVPFEKVIQLKPEHCIPFYAKTTIYEYSEFDRTVFLDVDSYPLKSLDLLFNNAEKFQIQTTRQSMSGILPDHKFQWISPAKMFEHYSIQNHAPCTETNSSFIMFDKCDQAQMIFKCAEHCYASDFIPDYAHNIGYYPDELAFNAALSFLKIAPTYQRPIYFCDPDSKPEQLWDLEKKFYLVGLYGNQTTTHSHLWKWYDKIRCERIKEVTGDYGYKIDVTQKIANKANTRPRWTGIRDRKQLSSIFEPCI